MARRGGTTRSLIVSVPPLFFARENSGLVVAALEGKMCVLEGVHNLEAGALASIARLAQDRELPLPDGSMLVSERSFMDMRKLTGLTHAELVRDKRILPVHPSFRIVATASYPLHASQSGTVLDRLPWMTEEICGLFAFVDIPGPDRAEEEAIIKRLVPLNTPMEAIVSILDFAHKFRDISEGAGDGAQAGGSVLNKAGNLGTRQLIRILRRVAEDPEEDLHRAINRTLLSPFLPQLARMALQELLQESGIRPRPREVRRGVPPPEVKGNHLVVGNVKMPIFDPAKSDPEGEALVPRVSAAFFDNDLHTLVMRELIADFALGEQLILIGNQGVGKNRLTDRFLELINRPREYIQLHRDTTVQSLMVQPTVENGLIIYKDSPLVRAVKTGRVLVVDEADKAPVYITSVLKSLAETGEMTLTDGRKIRPASEVVSRAAHSRDIIVHPDFRLILLANRPGYPFLGNDFFSAIGDVFATHAVENPDVESEMALLSQAAPELSQETIKKLVLAFGDLRQAFDDGLVNYPYSLRELMHLVRHMKRFPEDEIDTVLRNVFDFDVMRKEYHEILLQILNKHGIPVSSLGVEAARRASGAKGGKKRNVMLKFEGDAADGMRRPQRGGRNMPNMRGRGRGGGAQAMPRNIAKVVDPKEGKVDPKNKPHRGGNTWRGGTGGSSTAGLGGRAGPYRLDLGHDVMQISDELKEQVPEEVKQAARQMAREGLERRLKEINMTAYDAAAYKEFYNNVQQEIRQLRVVLEGIQAKEKERVWLKNMTDGDLDDSKLIDGLTGEHAIYKRRGDEQPEFGATQKKPKRIKFVVDISGSMYRFNGLDGRLNRTLEAALMVGDAGESETMG